ncbi:MAG: glutathione synthase [Halothiobacillaceae bacterium]|nr:MAG: glutathione synthase [Halothiobacillaceae bacterium]
MKLGMVMDPIDSIKPYKDSSFAMLLAAQRRGWSCGYFELGDLFVRDGRAFGHARPVEVRDDTTDWFTLGEPRLMPLGELDILLMRKDPPFDARYLHATQILALAERDGALVANRPAALQAVNEKLFATHFPDCIPPTLVSSREQDIRAFLDTHGEIVLKPLDVMGGQGVFRIARGDMNLGTAVELLTRNGQQWIMAQKFLPAVSQGDKRILLIDGEPVPYALARIPPSGEFRANLAAGGRGVGVPLSERDRWLCARIGPTLRAMGLYFVGLDVIGDFVTEINVTSPTCIRELDACYGLDIAGDLLDALARHRSAASAP